MTRFQLYTLVKKPVNRLLVLLDRVRGLDFYRKVAYHIDDGSDYECTHPRLHGMLRKICEEAGREDAVLDVGCGKGRMLWFFSRYPFRLVDGIEYNPEIAAIARRNIEKLGLECRVFVTDACDFTQWENYNWFYFYNPFPDRVMGICLQRMTDSLRTNPRTLHIIYINPVCHQLLLDRGFTEVPAEYGLWETLWFPELRVLRRYRYDPEQLCAMASSEEATEKKRDGRVDYLVLVNGRNPLPDHWGDGLSTVKAVNAMGAEVEAETRAYEAYLRLKADLEENSGIVIELDSALRSPAEQREIMKQFTETYGPDYAARTVAAPGCSEHHTGLALDLWLRVKNEQGEWTDVCSEEDLVRYPALWSQIHARLADYGFILRYPEGKEPFTGFAYEPWHIRYVGSTDTAGEIMKQGWTLEEYLDGRDRERERTEDRRKTGSRQ